MIEDKFGAELLGLQLPVSSPGRLPPLQAAEPTSPPRLYPALPDSCTRCPPPPPPPGLRPPAGQAAPAPGDRGCKAGSPGWPSLLQGAAPGPRQDLRAAPRPPPFRPHFSNSPLPSQWPG